MRRSVDLTDFPWSSPEVHVIVVDCEECCMRDTEVCADCVVTFVVSREPGEALVIDADAERAVRLMARAGLVPELRHAVTGSG